MCVLMLCLCLCLRVCAPLRMRDRPGRIDPAETKTTRQRRTNRKTKRNQTQQPEFTQIDMEMAWMDRDAIMRLSEDLVAAIFR